MIPVVSLEPVLPEDMIRYEKRLKDTFAPALLRDPHLEMHISDSLQSMNNEALQIVHEGKNVGGAIVSRRGDAMSLEFFFVDTEFQNRHFGQAAWKALEARYPDVERWELITSCYEKRNIHLYVNKCGFAITEYFNPYHPDPSIPQDADDGGVEDEGDGLFKFEKTVNAS